MFFVSQNSVNLNSCPYLCLTRKSETYNLYNSHWWYVKNDRHQGMSAVTCVRIHVKKKKKKTTKYVIIV